jgi:ribosomal protein S18 acetylase RimI-like enzyme
MSSARRQGLSRRLCARLLAMAHERGARTGCLQADADNAATLAVYRRLSFADAGAYASTTTRRCPPSMSER